MINRLFQKWCIPLMLINNNIYSFGSGILISIASSVFVQLCFTMFSIMTQWHLYLAFLLLYVAGALSMYISCEISRQQSYFVAKNISKEDKRREIMLDIHGKQCKKWVVIYIVLISTILLGTITLMINQHYLRKSYIEEKNSYTQSENSSEAISDSE